MQNNAYIPEQVAFICKPSSQVLAVDWGEFEQKEEPSEDEDNPDIADPNKVVVRSTWVCDASSKDSIQSGVRWAAGGNYGQQALKEEDVEVIIENNVPFTKPRVLGFERRLKGGRAFKALLPDGYWVDMRDSVLLDAISTEGVSPGGFLNGEWIWAVIGSERAIVRVGSLVHKLALEGTARRTMKPISAKKLVVGGVYKTKGNKTFVYLGLADFYTFDSELTEDRKSYTHVHIHHKSEPVWYERYDFLDQHGPFKPEELIEHPHCIRNRTKPPAVVHHIDTIEVSSVLFTQIRNGAVVDFEQDMKNHSYYNKTLTEQIKNTHIWGVGSTISNPGEVPVFEGNMKTKLEMMGLPL
jgi:hypothetical protein